MTVEALLIWIIVGLVAGWLASLVVGGGRGLLGDLVVGLLGAFLGSHIFHWAGLRVPLRGIPGSILVAAVGAIVLLLLIRLVFGLTRR